MERPPRQPHRPAAGLATSPLRRWSGAERLQQLVNEEDRPDEGLQHTQDAVPEPVGRLDVIDHGADEAEEVHRAATTATAIGLLAPLVHRSSAASGCCRSGYDPVATTGQCRTSRPPP